MFDKNYTLALKIKNLILINFPYAGINVFHDSTLNEYFISTQNKELYYSDEFGKLILEINQNMLWGQGIFNFYFILDVRENELDRVAKIITLASVNEVRYMPWEVNNTPILHSDKLIGIENSSLAA